MNQFMFDIWKRLAVVVYVKTGWAIFFTQIKES